MGTGKTYDKGNKPAEQIEKSQESLYFLIVDDIKSVADLFHQVFRRLGCRADVAYDCVFAKSILENDGRFGGTIDCMLLDANMPSGGSSDLLRYVKSEHPNIYTVMITGDIDSPAALEMVKQNPDFILQKPVSIKDLDLLDRVREHKYKKCAYD